MMNISEPTPKEFLLIRPLSYVLELCGWAQSRAARQEMLEPIHVTFLRRAAWNSDGMASFDRIHHETGMPRYAVTRAAATLERRGFGKVKPDEENKRWKRLHINVRGLKCCERIDSKTGQFLMMRFRRDNTFRKENIASYYNFASYIYSAARLLPDPFRVLGPWVFPDVIADGSGLNAMQKQFIHFLEELQGAAALLESQIRAHRKQNAR